MQGYSKQVIADVLAANDIVEIIGARLPLKPAGGDRFKALCPFHDEKTPSFSVSRDRQRYYCFGCEKSGDAIAFLIEFEGYRFVEALQRLADSAGIRLPALSERDNRDDYVRSRLIELNQFAGRHFRAMLADPLKGGPGRRYLETRQLKNETIEAFGLGFAPDSWDCLLSEARNTGYEDKVLEASGLAKRGERGSLYDFFRDRLVIPIRDVAGNIVAFGGRDLSGESPAKYINSPENALYKKSSVLYGLHSGRSAIRKAKCAVLVEGYFDLLRCVDAGIENVVAPCGTALTAEQAALIHRYAPQVIVVFDGDAAGVRAALRGIATLMNVGLTVRALVLPEGQDPDDFIRAQGADAFRERLDQAVDFITFYAEQNTDRLASVEGRTDTAKELFSILLSVDDMMRREEYLKRMAHKLGLDVWACKSEFRKFEMEQHHAQEARRRFDEQKQDEEPRRAAIRSYDDSVFVAVLLDNGALTGKVRAALDGIELPEDPFTEVVQAIINHKPEQVGQALDSPEAQRLYAAAANLDVHTIEDPEGVVSKRLRRIRKEHFQGQVTQLTEDIRRAEQEKDTERMMQLLRLRKELNQELNRVGVV